MLKIISYVGTECYKTFTYTAGHNSGMDTFNVIACIDTIIKEHLPQTISVHSSWSYCLNSNTILPYLCCLFFPTKDFLLSLFPDRR
jgi:hypothetical protein